MASAGMRATLSFGAVTALVAVTGFLAVPAPAVEGQSLSGSYMSMTRQHRVAQEHDFTFLRNGTQVRRFVQSGYLIPVESNADFTLHRVSYPYARVEVATFIHRLGAQYRAACGEPLVVTSLTRPLAAQPRNASSRSVHPTGMALDLRVPGTPACRSWLERTLLSLEGRRVLDVTRERRPPHYHVAIFPAAYARYVADRGGSLVSAPEPGSTSQAVGERVVYRVRRGDTLWDIARRHGTTVEALRAENGIIGSRIVAGQELRVTVR